MSQEPGFPKISIIVVTYNAADTLQACFDSIRMQRYPNIELLVADGLSTDATPRIIKANEPLVGWWVSEKDLGIYDAMNKALDHVTGEWVYFLGADDVLFDAFSDLAFQLTESDAIYYGSVLTRGLKRWGMLDDYGQAKHGIFHQAIIYPAAVFKKYKYELKYPVFADAVLNMICHGDPGFRFIFKDLVIANFNHTGSSGNDRDLQFEKDKPGLILRNFGFAIWARFVFRRLKEQLRRS